jgi:hypothetical protein
MTIEQIRAAYTAKPFRPFIIHLERFTIGLRTARHEADSYEPEAQASEFSESMHSLALRARIKCAQRNREAL